MLKKPVYAHGLKPHKCVTAFQTRCMHAEMIHNLAQALGVRFPRDDLFAILGTSTTLPVPHSVGELSDWPLLAGVGTAGGAAAGDDDEDEEDEDPLAAEGGDETDDESAVAGPTAEVAVGAAAGACGGGACSICDKPLLNPRDPERRWTCPDCAAAVHMICLAETSLIATQAPRTRLIPQEAHCDGCGFRTSWGNVVLAVQPRLPSAPPGSRK